MDGMGNGSVTRILNVAGTLGFSRMLWVPLASHP